MEEFIKAIKEINFEELTKEYEEIEKHIKKGYITLKDKIILDSIELQSIAINRIKTIIEKNCTK